MKFAEKTIGILLDLLDGVDGLSRLNDPYFDTTVSLVADNPNLYHALRKEGWPVWRWDESDPNCNVSKFCLVLLT